MPHYRTQIREKVASILSGLTTTGTNVFQSRTYPLESVPALKIYAGAEIVEEDDEVMGDHVVAEISVRIEAVSKKVVDLDDELDTILGEVQTAIAGNKTLDGLAYRARYNGAADPELSDVGDQEHGTLVISYTVTTGFFNTAPETISL